VFPFRRIFHFNDLWTMLAGIQGETSFRRDFMAAYLNSYWLEMP